MCADIEGQKVSLVCAEETIKTMWGPFSWRESPQKSESRWQALAFLLPAANVTNVPKRGLWLRVLPCHQTPVCYTLLGL